MSARLCGMAMLVLATWATGADAACPRPTLAEPQIVDGTHVRVHYTLTGADAIPSVADANVVRDVAEEALEAYASWGYPLPPADCDGDDRYDVYLVQFTAADGQTVPESCVAANCTCSSYARVARDLGRRYPSTLEGARTVVAHELFHAVQYAITSELPPFWAEGTAQYAANALHPELRDLERFLPTYFAEPERPLDSQGASSVGAWQYATAIWPVYLDARFGRDAVRDMLRDGGADAFAAMDGVLIARGSSLGAAFAEFAVWNAATGARGAAGYPDGAAYPEVPITPFDDAAEGVLTSLGARYFALDLEASAHLELTSGDEARLSLGLVPQNASGTLQLDALRTLSTGGIDAAAGTYLLVVASSSPAKRDNPFAVHSTPLLAEAPAAEAPVAGSPQSSSCSLQGRPTPMPRSALVPLVLFGLALASCKRAAPSEPQATARIVSVGSANTETVFALGKGGDVVAVDTSSLFPETATKLPQVGYQRALSAEGVLSVRPTLVLLPVEGGPPDVVAQLRSAGLRIETVDVPGTEAGTRLRIEKIAALLGVDPAPLATKVDAEVAAASAEANHETMEPKVLVLYARGPGTVQAFGQKTPADRLLALAHAKNAAQGFEGNRPISAEAVVAWAPDVIVVPARGLDSLGGAKGVLEQPGLGETPAGKSGRVVPIDDLLLLGFGPRLGEAVRTLSHAVHP
jgi:iron complex transport system substrate-binding protein